MYAAYAHFHSQAVVVVQRKPVAHVGCKGRKVLTHLLFSKLRLANVEKLHRTTSQPSGNAFLLAESRPFGRYAYPPHVARIMVTESPSRNWRVG